jgi:N-acyl-D-amino-acid deacylase
MRFRSLPVVVLGLASLAQAAEPEPAVKAAVEKGLRRIEAGAANYTKNRQCFSCHHQATALMTLSAAQKRGFTIDKDAIPQQLDFSLTYIGARKEQILKGSGLGGANTMAAYSLFSLSAAGHPADETTAALIQFLLMKQKSDGSWPPVTQRPPTEGSLFTNAALAIRSLRDYAPRGDDKDSEELRKRIGEAVERGKQWLLKAKPETMEDKAFHLRGLVYAEADKESVEAARTALLKQQRDDGSWSQLAEMEGDAYATGIVLTALRQSGVDPTTPAYQKGIKYLLKTQTEDGAWIVQTRSRPIQVFFDNGDPGEKSQFISFAATGWAVLALLDACPTP